MITYLMLREANLAILGELGQAWHRFGQRSTTLENEWEQQVLGRLVKADWTGSAASAAREKLERHDDVFEIRAILANGLATTLAEGRSRFRELQYQLEVLVDEAHATGLVVDTTGAVLDPRPAAAPMFHMDPGLASRDAEQAAGLQREITVVVTRANNLDEEIGAALRRFLPYRYGEVDPAAWRHATDSVRAAAALVGVTLAGIPMDGHADRARGWWAALTPEQQNLYVQAYPQVVGRLDGLPTSVRDSANRVALRIAANDSRNLRDADATSRAEALLKTLEGSEYAAGAPLFLLDVDNRGEGKAVVAVGNPDTAKHQAVIVPGVDSRLNAMNDEIERAGRLQTSADHMAAAPGDVSVIAWLGYDSPEQNETAISGSAAAAGAPPLTQFVDVLQGASDHTHVTVVGHSYGSVVVGTAAAAGGLHADDIITAGSPGMGVDSVNDLHINPRHVWTGAAQGDDVSGYMSHFAHGEQPHTLEFGANRYVVDTHGHSDYWEPGSVSLKNQAAVVNGYYDRVTFEHGSAPL